MTLFFTNGIIPVLLCFDNPICLSVSSALEFSPVENPFNENLVTTLSRLSGDQVLMSDDFHRKKKNISGHNLLRISRILKSLVTLGQHELSHCIFVCLNNLAHGEMPELQSTVDSYWRVASKL